MSEANSDITGTTPRIKPVKLTIQSIVRRTVSRMVPTSASRAAFLRVMIEYEYSGLASATGATKSPCGCPQRARGLLFSVVVQDRVAHLDALVADTHAAGTIKRVGDKCVYLVLGLAAKRTSGDFIHLVALGKHESSMAREQRNSRSAKVQRGAAHRAKALLFQQTTERCYRPESKDCLPSDNIHL
jgi:hypothetical protein